MRAFCLDLRLAQKRSESAIKRLTHMLAIVFLVLLGFFFACLEPKFYPFSTTSREVAFSVTSPGMAGIYRKPRFQGTLGIRPVLARSSGHN
jgi:hypothetical protein